MKINDVGEDRISLQDVFFWPNHNCLHNYKLYHRLTKKYSKTYSIDIDHEILE